MPAFLPSHSSVAANDVFNISDICLPEVSVNYDFHTYKVVTLDVGHNSGPCLSPKACIATTMESVDLVYRDPNSYFSVIFDSGASLGISFDKNNFVGPIRPLPNHKLGGFVNNMEVAGIGTVK